MQPTGCPGRLAAAPVGQAGGRPRAGAGDLRCDRVLWRVCSVAHLKEKRGRKEKMREEIRGSPDLRATAGPQPRQHHVDGDKLGGAGHGRASVYLLFSLI